jgi:hypothetical protein
MQKAPNGNDLCNPSEHFPGLTQGLAYFIIETYGRVFPRFQASGKTSCTRPEARFEVDLNERVK